MSVRVMSAVFERYPEGGGEMLLALALADHASDDGSRVYPSVSVLAEKTRQSERTVQYQLRRMEESGWLILVGSGNGGRSLTREYQISPEWLKGAEIAPIQKGATDDIKGAKQRTKGCKPAQERVQPIAPANNHHRTVIEPSKKQKTQAAPAFELPSWINQVHWDAWHSCAKRKKATVQQKLMAVEKLKAWRDAGQDFAGALENAAVGGWQGLFLPDSSSPRVASQPSGETAYQRSMRERMAEAAPEFARRPPGQQAGNAADFFKTIDVTARTVEMLK